MNILIVDDDRIDRELIHRALKKSELETSIFTATTVDEGLATYVKHPFDIVLLDYRMPKRNGIEMVTELRKERLSSATAIVMMSSSEDETLALECIKAGAQDFLIKSDINAVKLKRAVLHSQARFEIEKQLNESYKKVKLLAESDSLTGLANRYFFEESLKLSIKANSRTKNKISLLMIDLDNFKFVNDTYGHAVGDKLLQQVAARIKSCLRENELFARLGGDEFAINLSNLNAGEQASLVGRRIIEKLEPAFMIDNIAIQSSASIGISVYPDNGLTSESLFKYSDIAMYRAKKLGRNRVCFFEENMQAQFTQRMIMEQEIKDAEVRNQFLLFFQPILLVETETVSGFEALIRWDLNGHWRLPSDFIPVAEETRQIISIGRWACKQAISTLSKWNHASEQNYTMAINVSLVQLQDSQLIKHIRHCLTEFNVEPSLLEIELTETALLGDTSEARKVIIGLHRLGCRISLDDFGTGFSSISHLQQFPISVVKIDRSLMPKKDSSTKDKLLMKGLAAMAHTLELDIIAEGIENQTHLSFCKQLKIQKAQGYYFSKPLQADVIEKEIIDSTIAQCQQL